VQVLLTQILNQEPLIGESKRPALRQLLQRLVAKLLEPQHSQFDLFKVSSQTTLVTEGKTAAATQPPNSKLRHCKHSMHK
jgi:hypothetical protein